MWPCHYCWGVALYYCVYHNKHILSRFFFSGSAPWLLGLHVFLGDQHFLVNMFLICNPWTTEQLINLTLPMGCFCSWAKPCRDLVLSLGDPKWFVPLALILHLLEGTWSGMYKTIMFAKFPECWAVVLRSLSLTSSSGTPYFAIWLFT